MRSLFFSCTHIVHSVHGPYKLTSRRSGLTTPLIYTFFQPPQSVCVTLAQIYPCRARLWLRCPWIYWRGCGAATHSNLPTWPQYLLGCCWADMQQSVDLWSCLLPVPRGDASRKPSMCSVEHRDSNWSQGLPTAQVCSLLRVIPMQGPTTEIHLQLYNLHPITHPLWTCNWAWV